MRKHAFTFLFTFIAFTFVWSQDDSPAVGVPTFISEVEISEGSLLLLGEATEQGFSQGQSFRIVDRRRLDAVLLAREEVRHEDYLASDRESIQAIGADYLLIGRITKRDLTPAEYQTEKGIPARALTLEYKLTLSLLEVSSSRLMHTQEVSLKGFFQTELGQPEMNNPIEAYLPQVEQQAATQLVQKVRNFARSAFQGGMQMVDVIHQKAKKIEVILVASTMNTQIWQKINLYINEYYEIEGESLVRPVVIAEARVMSEENRLFVCKVTDGDRALKEAYDAGHEIYAAPLDKNGWFVRLMLLGQEY